MMLLRLYFTLVSMCMIIDRAVPIFISLVALLMCDIVISIICVHIFSCFVLYVYRHTYVHMYCMYICTYIRIIRTCCTLPDHMLTLAPPVVLFSVSLCTCSALFTVLSFKSLILSHDRRDVRVQYLPCTQQYEMVIAPSCVGIFLTSDIESWLSLNPP